MVATMVKALGLEVNLLAPRLTTASTVEWVVSGEVKPTKEPREVK